MLKLMREFFLKLNSAIKVTKGTSDDILVDRETLLNTCNSLILTSVQLRNLAAEFPKDSKASNALRGHHFDILAAVSSLHSILNLKVD